MAPALPYIAAVGAIVGAGTAVYSGIEQANAAKEAEDIAKKNAQLQLMETQEQARRLEKEQTRTEGLARAMAAASGVGGESQEAFLKDMEKTHGQELNWLKKSGYSQASIIRKGGAAQARGAMAQGYATAATGAVSGAQEIASWWG